MVISKISCAVGRGAKKSCSANIAVWCLLFLDIVYMPTSHADTINLDTLLMRSTHIVVALASNPHYVTELVEKE